MARSRRLAAPYVSRHAGRVSRLFELRPRTYPPEGDTTIRNSKRLSGLLRIVQGLLALFFGPGNGAPKLLLPDQKLALPLELPHLFVQCIGVCELLAALGLILPGLVRIRPGLTLLAAVGLVLVTVGATGYQLVAGNVGSALFAVAAGLISAFVAYGHWRLAPHPGSSHPTVLQLAH